MAFLFRFLNDLPAIIRFSYFVSLFVNTVLHLFRMTLLSGTLVSVTLLSSFSDQTLFNYLKLERISKSKLQYHKSNCYLIIVGQIAEKERWFSILLPQLIPSYNLLNYASTDTISIFYFNTLTSNVSIIQKPVSLFSLHNN